MFFKDQSKESQQYYGKMLTIVGSLSKLFSENDAPYFDSRVAENLFCKSFDAQNLARSDVSYDALKDGVGIGIKTFLNKKSGSYEKVAEFNSALSLFSELDTEEKIKKVSELRNDRIETTQRIYGADNAIYHCIVREPGKIVGYESPMELVDIANIKNVVRKKNVITFEDGKNQYKFSISKSVLIKKFDNKHPQFEIPVNIIDDPFEVLEKLMGGEVQEIIVSKPKRTEEHIYLPLYSHKDGNKFVFEKSGLNQWNAGGRPRDLGEVYVPVPADIHKNYPKFFPARDTHFNLLLPNGKTMEVKLCQDGSKALMSKPNNALGEWLLRDVLNLQEGELLTYERLEEVGLDSVVIYKKDNENFDIDFAPIGSYEAFLGDDQGIEDEE